MHTATDPQTRIYADDLQQQGCKNRPDSGSPPARRLYTHPIPLCLILLFFTSCQIFFFPPPSIYSALQASFSLPSISILFVPLSFSIPAHSLSGFHMQLLINYVCCCILLSQSSILCPLNPCLQSLVACSICVLLSSAVHR